MITPVSAPRVNYFKCVFLVGVADDSDRVSIRCVLGRFWRVDVILRHGPPWEVAIDWDSEDNRRLHFIQPPFEGFRFRLVPERFSLGHDCRLSGFIAGGFRLGSLAGGPRLGMFGLGILGQTCTTLLIEDFKRFEYQHAGQVLAFVVLIPDVSGTKQKPRVLPCFL